MIVGGEVAPEDLNTTTQYDWKTVQALCINTVKDHPAYQLSFSEYQERRREFIHGDADVKVHLSYYLPKFIGSVCRILARNHKLSLSHFCTLLIEMGLITFQQDYHDTVSAIAVQNANMYNALEDPKNIRTFKAWDKMTISLNSINGYRDGNSIHQSPMIGEWLAGAIVDTAMNLNMTQSDFAFLCVCKGLIKLNESERLVYSLKIELDEMIAHFESELNRLEEYTTTLLNKME